MLLSPHLDGLHGAPALPRAQEGPQHLSLCSCFSGGLGKLGGSGEQTGRALKSTDLHRLLWLSCNQLPRLPPSPSLRQYAFVCLWGYHQEKKGFRL